MSENSKKQFTDFQDKKDLGIFLNLKTRIKSTSEIFDYSSDKNNNLNTFINEKTYLYRSENNIIKGYKDQGSSSKDDQLLFIIRSTNKSNKFYIDNSVFNFISLEKLRNTKNYLWYVINSESEKINNPNKNYYLTEGDIIKIGRVKYFVKKIFIKKKEKEKEEERINNYKKNQDERNKYIIPECKEYKKCDFCNEILFHLCKCKEYQHINCIKKWIEERKIIIENKKKTVKNYYLNIFFCDECISKEPYCIESECKCEKCNTFYPLEFKYSNNENKKEDTVNFFPIPKPSDSDYMILESLEYRDEYKNSPRIIKAIHVINLTGEEINIGRDIKNDIIVNHSSVSSNHAVIKNVNGKFLLKNKSERSGTLVLIQNKYFDFPENEVYLQVDKTFISAKIMKESDFSKIKNEETVYPLIKEGKKTEENSNIQSIDDNNLVHNSNNKKNGIGFYEVISDNNNNNNNEEVPPSYGAIFYGNK